MKNLIFCFCILIMVSCKPAQKIAYSTDRITTLEASQNINVSLSVQTFEDIRSQESDNFLHLTSKQWSDRINNQLSCLNSEVLYKTPVAEQMTFIFSQHLMKKLPQALVYVNYKENTDYYLEAKIKYFHGVQKHSTAAMVGSQFGLIGALATAGAKTNGTIIIELTDVKLFDKQNNLIASIDTFRKEYEGDFPADANCFCIYQNVNQKLQEFNDELIGMLSIEMRNRR